MALSVTKDRVFVTGASGLLGTNVVALLARQNYAVTALVRERSRFVGYAHENIRLIEGDITNKELLTTLIKGCRYVVHIAALTSQSLLTLDDYLPTNEWGTQCVVDASIANRVEKLIYIGTANTCGYGSLQSPGSETSPMRYPFTKSLYALSKLRAQAIIDNAAAYLPVITLSPTFMLGPFDSKPSSGRIIQMALNKPVLFYPSGGKNFVHVKDVAVAVCKALALPATGQRYILANENLSYKAFYRKVLRLNRQKSLLIPIPNWMLNVIGLLGDLCRWCKVETEVSSVNTKIVQVLNFYTNQKAKQELDMVFTPVDDAIIDYLDDISQPRSGKKAPQKR